MALEAQGLCVAYGGRKAVEGLSLGIRGGEILALVGPNGSGKTSLLKALAGVLPAAGGGVFLDARPLASYRRRELARRIGLVAQVHPPLEDLLVAELVGYGRFSREGAGPPGARGRKVIAAALRAVGLEAFAGRELARLSGGERQRAWIAMALAQEPDFLLLDEPTTHLDLAAQLELLALLKELRDQRGLGIGIVLHDLNQAAALADRMALLSGGHLLASGPPREVMRESLLSASFGVAGRVFDAGGKPHFAPERSLRHNGEAGRPIAPSGKESP